MIERDHENNGRGLVSHDASPVTHAECITCGGVIQDGLHVGLCTADALPDHYHPEPGYMRGCSDPQCPATYPTACTDCKGLLVNGLHVWLCTADAIGILTADRDEWKRRAERTGVRCPRCREVKGLDCCQQYPCPCTCHLIERATPCAGPTQEDSCGDDASRAGSSDTSSPTTTSPSSGCASRAVDGAASFTSTGRATSNARPTREEARAWAVASPMPDVIDELASLETVRRETIEACAVLVETLPSMGLREVAARIRSDQSTSATPEEKPCTATVRAVDVDERQVRLLVSGDMSELVQRLVDGAEVTVFTSPAPKEKP